MTDKLNVNPLVALLVGNPAKPPDLMVLNGYIGPSPVANRVRLWTSATMHLFVDIPIDQIKGRTSIGPNSESPWVEDIIWINREDAAQLSETPARAGQNAPPPGGGVTGPNRLYPPRP